MALAAAVIALVVVSPAQAAPADFPLKLRLVDPGVGGDPAAERVMVQMSVDGQQDQTGSTVEFYGPAGSLASSFTIPAPVAVGQAGRTILLGPAASAPTPDFELAAEDRIDPAAGAVCLLADPEPDCVAWGSFPAPGALPDPQLENAPSIAAGSAVGRRINRDCKTWLGPLDDKGNSDWDFAAAGPEVPAPRRNVTAPPVGEVPCLLDTGWNLTPANPSSDTTPTFAFGTVPVAYTAYFCSFDGAPFSECDPLGTSFGPLPDATYEFEVFAQNAAGPDPTPLHWTFEVDTVPPQTSITQLPPEPSSGFAASFAFVSSEPHSTFLCQLESGPIQTCESPQTYFNLADGPHSFRVWASDQASNLDPSPAHAGFNVDTSIDDVSPPETTILAAPSKQSSRASASFTYRSNEPRSSFQCRLDDRPFQPCPATGLAYPALRNGSHTFAVRAIDRAGNADLVPDTHTWTVRAPLPRTEITRVPSGATFLRGGGRTRTLTFAFASDRSGSSFRCRLDKGEFERCTSPHRLRVKAGRHRFEVYAVDQLGNEDPTPERRIFRVIRPRAGFFAGGGR